MYAYTRYDPANEGVINGQKLLNSLGIEWRNSSREGARVSPVEGGSRVSVTSGKGTVRLTPIEDEIAKTGQGSSLCVRHRHRCSGVTNSLASLEHQLFHLTLTTSLNVRSRTPTY